MSHTERDDGIDAQHGEPEGKDAHHQEDRTGQSLLSQRLAQVCLHRGQTENRDSSIHGLNRLAQWPDRSDGPVFDPNESVGRRGQRLRSGPEHGRTWLFIEGVHLHVPYHADDLDRIIRRTLRTIGLTRDVRSAEEARRERFRHDGTLRIVGTVTLVEDPAVQQRHTKRPEESPVDHVPWDLLRLAAPIDQIPHQERRRSTLGHRRP